MNSTDNFNAKSLRTELLPETAFIDYKKQIVSTDAAFTSGTIGIIILAVYNNSLQQTINSNLSATAQVVANTVVNLTLTPRGSKAENRDLQAAYTIPVGVENIGLFIPCDLESLSFGAGYMYVMVIERTVRGFDV